METTVQISELAENTSADRNRSVDFYRAVAMMVVALGHWAGMVVVWGSDGELDHGNLLDFAPHLWWVTWIGQVMPLFFFVGGFASAVSLRSARRRGTRDVDWIATRLRRMMAPAVALAVFWCAALSLGAMLGAFSLVAAAAVGAAIPLWFLANYVIDTALAPFTFRLFRRRPVMFPLALGSTFVAVELAHTAGVPYVGNINWVIGWLGFQVAGFAWQLGRLPPGRRLLAATAGAWTVTIAAIAFGPWPATMLHHGGLDRSPTHPPSVGFVLFGFAYSLTAALLAPRVNRWLTRSARAWTNVVRANGVAMSVYLWHMTAAVITTGIFYALGLIGSQEPATTAWWAAKLPWFTVCVAVLLPIVWKVNPIERRALLGGPVTWPLGTPAMLASAGVISMSVKLWSSSHIAVLVSGCVVVALLWPVSTAMVGHDRRAQRRQ